MLGLGSRELGDARVGEVITAPECSGHWAVGVALCVSLFVLSVLLVSIVITVGFIYCGVKLSLSQPMRFLPFSFHSPPHPSGGRGGRAATWPFVASHGQTTAFNLAPNTGVGIMAGLSRVC